MRRVALVAAAIAVLLGLLALALRLALPPERLAGFALSAAGEALELEISAAARELRLRGQPTLVLHDVVARQPGAATALLRAERLLLALPWSTLRSRGRDLDVVRIELDAPLLDVAALRRWQASRPPAETRIPILREGLHVARGRIDGDGWRIDDIALTLPRLHPQQPLRARLRGRYAAGATAVPFDLALAMSRPAATAGAAAVGRIAVEQDDWRLPAQLRLSAPLRMGEGGFALRPLRLALAARFESGETRLPFALGVYGPLRFDGRTWALAPAAVALRGEGVVPDLDARGAAAFGQRLLLRFDGTLPRWPEAWPALPPPIGESQAPLSFALTYLGGIDFAQRTQLGLRREAAAFDARFRLPEVLAWIDAGAEGTPLPPLSGSARAPRLEIAGATLEGVEIEFDDAATETPP